jgi:fructokinase
MPTLCLGEALVDLVCERPVDDIARADSFVPRFGGATANVAVTAARHRASVALAGGAGDDAWGRWLRGRLESEGVGLEWFELLGGARTPVAFVTADSAGEPSFEIYGETIETVLSALAGRLEEAVEECSGLFFGSNTLVKEREREVTMTVREQALALERPVIFDPNLRLHRWSSRADAAASANACVPGALLVRCNQAEAALMTGEEDPERAAGAMVKAGARLVVVTLGAEGAILRGEHKLDVDGVKVSVVSTAGAGDALTGVLLAHLARTNYYPPAVAAGLKEGVAEAARACERWSALD